KIATTVFDKKADSKNKTSILVANLLDYYMEYYKSKDMKSHLKEYINRSNIIGKNITVNKRNMKMSARAIDIDSKCRLKIQDEEGKVSLLSYGEVSIDIQD
ncbi:MAG: biotin--[acetyl-CoA-carboxylase] ligase, partial [Eubacterium sp.]|nr:biotin--[acetyl-CoA-carboxylase] ligase [Eubacterium sp.]